MRFRRLDLIAYGKFTGASVEIPAEQSDLHLIYGPNEAGKSTLRSAVVDFLYGIPGQTKLNFLHAYKRMRVGAIVEGRGQTLELVRRKANKATLWDAADEPLQDEVLGALLGGSDRAFFERMFALSHERLRAGGDEILQGKDDAAEALFAAAAGVRGLHALREELEQEGSQLWTPRKWKTVEYHRNAESLKAATTEKKEATAQAKDWAAADQARVEAESAYESAKAEHRRLGGRRARLERVRRVAPHVRARRQAKADRVAMGKVRLLPLTAAETVREIRDHRELALDRLNRLDPDVERLEREIGEVRPDLALIERASEVQALTDERISLSRHPGDIVKRQAEARAAEKAMLRASQQLGWGEAADTALESRVPSRMARAELRGSLEGRGAIEERAAGQRERLEERHSELRELRAKAKGLKADPVSAGWKAVLESARDLRDAAARRSELNQSLAKDRGEWQRAVLALHPWQGSKQQLRLPPPVSAGQAREWIEEQRACDASLDRLAERTRETLEKLETRRLELAQLVRDRAPVTSDQVNTARQDRDRIWSGITSGVVVVSDVAAEYEGTVAEADSVADRRFEGAEVAGRWTNLTNEIEHLEQEAAALDSSQDQEQGRAAMLRDRWRSAAEKLGDAEFLLADYAQWLGDRDRALEKAVTVDAAEAALTAFDGRVEEVISALREAWVRESGLPAPARNEDLGTWLARTESIQQSRSDVLNELRQIQQQTDKMKVVCENAEVAAAKAEQERLAWQEDWRERVLSLGLPATTSPEAGVAALDVFDDLERASGDLREKRNRIGKMEADLNSFATKARSLAETLLPEWVERPADEIAAEFNRRLHQAQAAEKERGRLAKELKTKRADVNEVRQQMADAEASVRPLLQDAGANDLDVLQLAIDRSDRARAMDALIEEKADEALQAGSPLDLAELEAELDAEEDNDIATELSEIESELNENQDRLQSAVEKRKDAEHAIARFPAGDVAAQAEARRQEVLSEMIAVSESWVRATVGARLLGWAIHRYRERRQTPLLQRASTLFAELTLGSFERLMVEDAGDKTVIVARRSGEDVGVDAMSNGTLDQLYLALRIAAMELHLDKGEPLPFLADDLFVNWDNNRAKAGLRVLAELACRTQVLFLTHHEHLIELAREAVGPSCSTLKLDE